MRKTEVVSTTYANTPSPELLTLYHKAKSTKDGFTAGLINSEFIRRDRIAINESILGVPKERPAPIIEKEVKLKIKRVKAGTCEHCYCMLQQAMFGGTEMKMCCRCGNERRAA